MGKNGTKKYCGRCGSPDSGCKKKEKQNHPVMRKGFVQVIEVAIAALLIVLVMPVFFSSLSAKQDWARHDLIVSGSGIVRSLEAGGNMSQILNNTQEIIRGIEALKPANVKYSIYAEGTPKPGISIACVSCSDAQLSYAQGVFTPAIFNGRLVNFTVEKFDMGSQPLIPGNFDAAVFIDYSGWAAQKQKISDYLAQGKGIVAMQAASGDSDFLNMFNLSVAGGSASYQNFTAYYPAGTNIEKYFIGFGFDVATPADAGSGYNKGDWHIWDAIREVNTTGAKVGFKDSGTELSEGQTFSLSGAPDGITYSFRVKKIWSDKSGAVFQPLDKRFVFNDFLGASESKVKGNSILAGEQAATYSLMAKNNSAIWISSNKSFANDDYRALVKAAAASLAESFYLVKPQNPKNSVNVNAFESFCCDAPETVRLTFSLWYVY